MGRGEAHARAAWLVQDKRVELAIGAAGMLDGRMHLAVAGDGPDAERLRLLAGAGHVRFLGRVPGHDELAWIAASGVLIHPSAVEAAPTVVREARALGTSVVACASGDVERWAGVDRGIVIAEPTVASIAQAVSFAAAWGFGVGGIACARPRQLPPCRNPAERRCCGKGGLVCLAIPRLRRFTTVKDLPACNKKTM